MKKILVILAILVLALSLVGCEEEDEKDHGHPHADDDGDDMESGSAEADVEEESEAGFGEKFTDLIKNKMSGEYTVEYKMSTNDPETDGYVMKQFFGGKDKFRSDVKMDEGEARMYMVKGTLTSCNDMQGDWQCMKMEGMDESVDMSAQFKGIDENPADYDINFKGTKKVAGATAYCFDVMHAELGMGEMQYCLSKEGVPLLMTFDIEGMEGEMRATTFKKSVKSSDFVPPAEAQDMSAMMEEMMGQMPEGMEEYQ